MSKEVQDMRIYFYRYNALRIVESEEKSLAISFFVNAYRSYDCFLGVFWQKNEQGLIKKS